MRSLPPRAAVVIVGGGVIGVSVAFHLAEAGVQDVLLLERSALGAGSTSKAAGGVRSQFSDELNVRIAQRSLAAYQRFAARPGGDIGLHQVGYLFLLTASDQVPAFERSIALQNDLGVPTRLLTPDEAQQRCPIARMDDVLAASFCPEDGLADPDAVVAGYAAGARAQGATLVTGCEVVDIDTVGDTIRAVITADGRVETDTVICAAGAWSRQVGDMVGVDLPVEPYRRQVVTTPPLDWVPRDLPLTIEFASSLYFHGESGGLLMGMGEASEPPGFNETLDPGWVERISERAVARIPRLGDAGFAGGWAGLYEVTPDHNALIGIADGPARFVYATGFSGHGFLQGPAVGEIVRDLVLERAPFVDVGPLSVERFERRASRPEHNII